MTAIRPGRVLSNILALLLLATPGDLVGQSRTTSAIRGQIIQTGGAPLADVSVVIRHLDTGFERSGTTDLEGTYFIQLLPPGGPYRLTISRLGYETIQLDSVRLQVGEIQRWDGLLIPAAVEVEGLDVSVDRNAVFDVSMVGPATFLDERTVESVPILSRDFMDLATLSPQVTATEGGGFSIGGQNDRYNALLVDGVSAKDLFGVTSGTVPGGAAGARLIPFDAIAQYEILAAPFDVRLSGFTGGVLNAVTRTGTNDWRVRASAVHRTESLLGDLSLPLGRLDGVGVDRSLLGLSVGGPIIHDQAHFFVTGEFERRNEPPDGYNLDRVDPRLARISPASMMEFVDAFGSTFGEDPGAWGSYTLERRALNLFGRLDWTLGDHRLTVRNVYASGDLDDEPNRAAFRAYELSSNAVFRESSHNLLSAQLFSDLGDGRANELTLSIQRTRDRARPASRFPQVEVDLTSSIGGATYGRAVRAGSQYHAQDSDLGQTTIRLVESYSFPFLDSNYTIGATAAFYDFDHRDLPGSAGAWTFASLDDLRANVPSRYERTVLAPGADPEVGFQVTELGTFIQNRIDLRENVTMHFGMRVDVPFIHGRPEANPVVAEEVGYATTHLPNATVMLSPRWGFNWQSEGLRRTQLRLGAGYFSGELPYIWMANAFQNNGLRTATLICDGRRTDEEATGPGAPALVPGSLPQTCANGDPRVVRNAIVFKRKFKYPRYIKMLAAVDREIFDWLDGSLDFLFTFARNQVSPSEQNVRIASADDLVGPTGAYGSERQYYGTAGPKGLIPLRHSDGIDQVVVIGNDGEDWTTSATAELRARLGDRLDATVGYTLSRSVDRMSLVTSDMATNLGLSPAGHSVNRPGLRTSNYDRPHKIVVSLFGRPIAQSPDTEISLLYTGQSGLPYSYVYGGDINGDGYPGPGSAFDLTNDLVYVPETFTEYPASLGTRALFESALEVDDCLAAQVGDITRRNECRAPWQHRLDLRIAQRVEVGGAEIRFEGDIINVLNLLSSRWGRIQTVPSVVPILEPYDRADPEGFSAVGELQVRWAGPTLPGEDGLPRAALPWSVVSPDSQWQAQFGVRVTFGGTR